ncbi:transposase [Haloferula chungangensis]|uniref:Transposase n=1 Tax=Haloferula chungangensis TaxID=1048331 RepID=A0ABW2L5A8_9BACT
MYFDPDRDIEITGRELPPWQQGDACQFITFRLRDSLPKEKLQLWKSELEAWRAKNPEPWTPEQRDTYHRQFTYRFEHWLDCGYGSCLFNDPRNRQHLADVLMRFQGERVTHHSWVIMPNHVHLLFEPIAPLADLIKAWKGTSAHRIGRGSIWQKNYRDTLIRSAKHFVNAARYIRRNPAKLPPGTFTLWESDRVKSIE